jgi:hypothetical protein
VVAVVAGVVIAATDEGGPWAARLGMWAALAPVAGSIGALATVRLAAGRGEIRALEALGVAPLRAALGAVFGGAAIALLGPVVASSTRVPLDALFPRPPEAHVWVASGSFLRDASRGLRIDAAGTLTLEPATSLAAAALPAGTRLAVVALLAALAVVGPLWACAPGSMGRKAAVGVAGLLAAIVAFQAVAAGRAPAVVLLLPPLVLLLGRSGRS